MGFIQMIEDSSIDLSRREVSRKVTRLGAPKILIWIRLDRLFIRLLTLPWFLMFECIVAKRLLVEASIEKRINALGRLRKT